jgi:hypothetical protein
MVKRENQKDLFDRERVKPVTFTIQPGLWQAFMNRAQNEEVPASLILRKMIRTYIDENQQLELRPGDKQK